MERIAFECSFMEYKLQNYGWILQPEYEPRKMNKTKYTDFENIVEFKLMRQRQHQQKGNLIRCTSLENISFGF